MSKADELQRLVAPDCLDQLRARAIRARRDVPDDRRRFERHAAVHERPDDQQPLPGLEVQSNFDGELAVQLKPRLAIQTTPPSDAFYCTAQKSLRRRRSA